ncbi:M4 family metallopeptidase [Cohnella fermenti]|nr:M4 family metallopeptidase [Cohnella fermenti]
MPQPRSANLPLLGARTIVAVLALLLLAAAAVPAAPGSSGRSVGAESASAAADEAALGALPAPYSGGDYLLVHASVGVEGAASYLLQAAYRGIPIYGSYLSLDRPAGSEELIPRGEPRALPEAELSALNTTPSLTESEAIAMYKAELARKLGGPIGSSPVDGDVPAPKASLVIYSFGGIAHLAYETELRFTLPELGDWVGWIDAHTGLLIDEINRISGMNAIAAASASGSTSGATSVQAAAAPIGWGKGYNGAQQSFYISSEKSTGKPTIYQLIDTTRPAAIKTLDFRKPSKSKTRPEGYEYIASTAKTFADTAAVDAHVNAKRVYLFYKNRFGRNSLDDKNMDILSFVHIDSKTMRDNAVWTGWAMYYGEATGLANGGANCTSCALDLVAHEMTHAVTQYTVGLEYRGQSGALNESISDIMASVMDSDDWEIGEDTGAASRSLADPAKYGQPASMSEYVDLPVDEKHDNGGVHVNSGIPNHAAYLTALKIDNADFGLKGRDTLGRLTYVLLRDRLLSPTASFQDARDAYIVAASRLSGLTDAQKSKLASLVSAAWQAVGIGNSTNLIDN